MKGLISLAQKTGIYTGKEGTYCAAVPDTHSIKLIKNFCKKCKIEDIDEDLHCTIIYSPDKAITIQEAKTFPRLTYKAKVSKWTWWLGHDKEGYLVMELVCPLLNHSHDVLRDVGAVPTFDEYKPHITIKHPLKFSSGHEEYFTLRKLNKQLEETPLEIKLVDTYIEDINKD